MIGLGIVILFTNYGLVGWDTWDILWRLWPILLVAIGLDVMLGRRWLWASFLVVLFMVGGLTSLIWFYGGSSAVRSEIEGRRVYQGLDDIDQAIIYLRPAVGELSIDPTNDKTALIAGEVKTDSNPEAYIDYSITGNTGIYKIDSIPNISYPGVKPWNWALTITDQISLDIETSMAVGRLDINLQTLNLSNAEINQAVGEILVVLPQLNDYRAEISQAVGSIVVDVPENTGLKINISRAISNLSIPPSFEKRGNYYYSVGYETADYKIDLRINQAVGNIVIR
jgi:hypothetical protein